MKTIAFIVLLLLTMSLTAYSAPGHRQAPAKPPWSKIVKHARGATVNLFMWGGDQGYNRYIDTYAAPALRRRYGIDLQRTPVSATENIVTKLLDEKQAGQKHGSIDLVWVNGNAFRIGAKAHLWYGPWAKDLPNAKYIDWQSPIINRDFGYPVNGREAPWSRAQLVMIYDSGYMPKPLPKTPGALLAWARKHPGRFTYPAPPDFTGTAFIEQIFILLTGKHYQKPFDRKLFQREAPKLWRYLNKLKPYLWRRGDTYPASAPKLDALYRRGETFMTMSYNPQLAQRQVGKGLFPPTTRTFVFNGGTLSNVNYLAIPFNAPHKAGAEVVANFLESPAAQIKKQDPGTLGALTVLDLDRLSHRARRALSLNRSPVTLPLKVLKSHRIPEANSSWIMPLVKGWRAHVAR
jgi:putative spermidine/putrescine transport system substrate-binding protein